MSTTAAQPNPHPPTSGEQYSEPQFLKDVHDFPRVPRPIYRHAAPSAPWPWMDITLDTSDVQAAPPAPPGDPKWSYYPQSLFGNWTHDQVDRSQMLTHCSDFELSTIYKIGVSDDGSFHKHAETCTVRTDHAADWQAFWKYLGNTPPSNTRVQALFVEEMTLPILQMLGTKYIVEPFFFASSINWIPSRYREDPKKLEDHITVILPFVRVLKKQRAVRRTRPLRVRTLTSTEPRGVEAPLPYVEEKRIRIIDTQAPLSLPGNKLLIQDLLSLHMVRKTTTSTIISYHPSLLGTSAHRLQSLVQRTGDSVYWSKIFKRSKDSTFLFLSILWYALYEWDEAFEVLFRYINTLEHEVLQSNDIKLTQELHKLQAHLLYYEQLLRDFLRSVEFVRDMHNPAMNAPWISTAEREDSAHLMHTEAGNLISEIERLTRQREMLSDRLDNAIHLTFATVNIDETKSKKGLRQAAMIDSAAMKQISYLAMIFLPGSYLANVFRMSVQEIHPPDHGTQTIGHYIAAVAGLTVFTFWLAIVLQKDSSFYPSDSSMRRRILWPLYSAYDVGSKMKEWIESADRHSPRNTLPYTTADDEKPY